MQSPVIIYEDNHLLVAQKPPGFLAQPDGSGRADLLSWAGDYLARHKPGRAFVGLTHRLDRAVGGVTALAKTSKCAARLSRQFRERTVEKIYLALTHGRPPADEAHLETALFREGTITRPAKGGEKGTRAALSFKVRRRAQGWTLLEVRLETGFKHQIRAQLAGVGLAVMGDAKYGGGQGRGPAIGLWAESLTLAHPTTGAALKFEAPPSAALWPWSMIGD